MKAIIYLRKEITMKIEKRNIALAVVLSIITCGIYAIVWVVKMMKEAVQFKDENDDALLEILLGIFLLPVGFFLAEKKFAEGCQAKGIPHEDRTILYLILGLIGLGIVDMIMLQSDLNNIADMSVPSASAFDAAAYEVPSQDDNQYS